MRFLLLAGIALPLLGAAWMHASARALAMPMPHMEWIAPALARSLAYLLLVPAFASVLRLLRSEATIGTLRSRVAAM